MAVSYSLTNKWPLCRPPQKRPFRQSVANAAESGERRAESQRSQRVTRPLWARGWVGPVHQLTPASSFFRVAISANDIPPALRDLGTLLRGQLVAIGLVALDARQVVLQPRPQLVEATEAEVLVQRLHLADRVGDEIFVGHFVKAGTMNQMPGLFEFCIELLEAAENVLFQALVVRPLQGVFLPERSPQVHGRRRHNVRIADHVHKAGVGKELQERLDAASVWRRLEHEPARVPRRQLLEELVKGPLPRGPGRRRQL